MRAWAALALGLAALAAVACGSRTGLLVPEDGVGDDGPPVGDDDDDDTTDDASVDASIDAARDSGRDASIRDALPPIDVSRPDVMVPSRCPDAATTFIYVVTSSNVLASFDPPTATFTNIGTLRCPTEVSGAVPFSMAVDRTGVAYVLYDSGELFRVSTATASCRATAFVPNHTGFNPTFGMGYSSDGVQGGDETLYIAGDNAPPRLGSIDTTNFRVRTLGTFDPAIGGAELTGTGAGDLFAFYAMNNGRLCDSTAPRATCPDSAIGQIDKRTGEVIGQTVLSGLSQGRGWAFAFWGGDFYTFTAPNGRTTVTRFRPSNGTMVTVARRTDAIVGAGVSTCAPVQ